MQVDPGETTDLSAIGPDVFQDVLAAYDAYAEETGVLEMPEGYDSIRQVVENSTARMRQQYGGYLLVFGLVLLVGLFGIYRGLRTLIRRA